MFDRAIICCPRGLGDATTVDDVMLWIMSNNSACEIAIAAGTSGEVMYAAGYPNTVDGFQIDFRVPSAVTPGLASVQLSVAWIVGGEVKVPVR